MVTIAFRVPIDLRDFYKRIADDERRRASDVFRMVLEDHAKIKRRPLNHAPPAHITRASTGTASHIFRLIMTDRILPPSQYDFEFELNRAFSRGEQKDFAQAARVDQSLVSRRFNPNETATESGMYAAAFELWCAKMTGEDLFEAFAAQIEGWIKLCGNPATKRNVTRLKCSDCQSTQ
jgi:hypothetical protein